MLYLAPSTLTLIENSSYHFHLQQLNLNDWNLCLTMTDCLWILAFWILKVMLCLNMAIGSLAQGETLNNINDNSSYLRMIKSSAVYALQEIFDSFAKFINIGANKQLKKNVLWIKHKLSVIMEILLIKEIIVNHLIDFLIYQSFL